MVVQNQVEKKHRKFTAEEWAAFVLLLIISTAGLFFGFKSFPANLHRPFEIQLANYTGEKFMTLSEKDEAEVERQKTTDTDGDGLMDYDELYVYKTSPYLTDSDSDSFDDKTEILSNHNPNCPEGKDCLNNQVAAIDSAGTNSPVSNDFFSGVFNFNTSQLTSNSFQSKEDIVALFSKMGASEIRSLLISQGIPKEQVDAMSDQEISDFFQAAINEAMTNGQFDEILSEAQTATLTENASGSSSSQ
jgi:hypothetical protein